MNTKSNILRTSLKLFLQNGYEKTSLNQIAQKVGITKPAIYHHFKNKDELFHEVLTFLFDEMHTWSSRQFRDCQNLEELLRAFMKSLKSFREVTHILFGKEKEDVSYSFLELVLTASKKDPTIQKRIEREFLISRQRLTEELRNAQKKGEIRSDIDGELFAYQIHALIEGSGIISYLDKSIDLETIGEQLFENIWTMLKK